VRCVAGSDAHRPDSKLISMNDVNISHAEPLGSPVHHDADSDALPAPASRSFVQGTASAGVEAERPPEADRPRTGVIGVAIVATLALLAGVVLGIDQLFQQVITDEVNVKVLARPSGELRELRAQEQQKLTRYQWVSQKDGVVRVPLSRARELTLGDYRRNAPTARKE
jgi:hypothetical protein